MGIGPDAPYGPYDILHMPDAVLMARTLAEGEPMPENGPVSCARTNCYADAHGEPCTPQA